MFCSFWTSRSLSEHLTRKTSHWHFQYLASENISYQSRDQQDPQHHCAKWTNFSQRQPMMVQRYISVHWWWYTVEVYFPRLEDNGMYSRQPLLHSLLLTLFRCIRECCFLASIKILRSSTVSVNDTGFLIVMEMCHSYFWFWKQWWSFLHLSWCLN